MAILTDWLPQEDSNELTARICENCKVTFPIKYDKCPKCGLKINNN